jgi:hypothetical protein
MVGKIIAPIVVLVLLVWMVIATTRHQAPTAPASPDVIDGVADKYIECAAYYALTARYLSADGDSETGAQYDERANTAFDEAKALSGERDLDLMRKRDTLMAQMGGNASAEGHGLAELGVTHDEECIALLDG